MSTPQRLLETFPSSHLYLLEEGRLVKRSDDRTGVELVKIYADMVRIERQLAAMRQLIEAVIDGPTVAEAKAKAEQEDADPEAAARMHGWTTEKELRAQLEAEGHPFHKWIYNNSRIVRLKREGGYLPKHHQERHHCAFDYLDVADDWADALKGARIVSAEKQRKQVQEALK